MPAGHGARGFTSIAAGPTHVPPAWIHRGVTSSTLASNIGFGPRHPTNSASHHDIPIALVCHVSPMSARSHRVTNGPGTPCVLIMRIFLVVAVLVFLGGNAGADVDVPTRTAAEDPTALGRSLRVPLVILEHAMMFAPPAILYWRSVDQQKEDWELQWNWETWKTKLTSTRLISLDTNRFEPNAIRHELCGSMTYQIGRANRFGVLASTVMNFGASWLWENVGEFRERPSLNDMIANTVSGILIGEPLFQIGKLGDGQGGLVRRGLGMLVSPFSRMQKELGLSPLADEEAPAHRIEMSAGANVTREDGAHPAGELRLGLDVEVMTDRAFGTPGSEATVTRFGGWNRMAVDVELDDREASRIAGYQFRSSTTYLGRYARDLDDDGHGSATFVGIGGAFHLHQRQLSGAELDRYSVLSLVGPRAGGWVRANGGELDWEVAATADLAMVQAHVFGLTPRMTDSSILLTRGYYYATGTTVSARVRARTGKWNAELEAIVHQFWSFDAHTYRGADDPKNVEDQRVGSTARIGVRPTARDLRVELYGDAVLRRGTWATSERHTSELTGGFAMTAGF